MPSPSVEKLGVLLAQKKLSIAIAESATAGRMCAEISLLPQSGEVLKGGIVCYDAEIKKSVLGVSEELIRKYTPESAEVTEAVAQALAPLIKADIYVCITGLTTSGGSETTDKPVGTMFAHLIINGQDIKVRKVFSGDAQEIVLQMIDATAENIISNLK